MSQYHKSGTICQRFGMSKMTLVRLEERGIINPPPKRLARNGQRQYTDEHVEQIRKYWESEKEPDEAHGARKRKRAA